MGQENLQRDRKIAHNIELIITLIMTIFIVSGEEHENKLFVLDIYATEGEGEIHKNILCRFNNCSCPKCVKITLTDYYTKHSIDYYL